MFCPFQAVRCSALHGYPLLLCCRHHGRALEHGLAPLIWPRLTSAPIVSLWYSHVPPSPQSKHRSPQVRTHPFSQSRLHLLPWVYCLRALACCAALPTQLSLLCSSCSSVPTFAVPLTSDPQSPTTPLRLANWLWQLASKGLSPSSFQASYSKDFELSLFWRTDVPILGTHKGYDVHAS